MAAGLLTMSVVANAPIAADFVDSFEDVLSKSELAELHSLCRQTPWCMLEGGLAVVRAPIVDVPGADSETQMRWLRVAAQSATEASNVIRVDYMPFRADTPPDALTSLAGAALAAAGHIPMYALPVDVVGDNEVVVVPSCSLGRARVVTVVAATRMLSTWVRDVVPMEAITPIAVPEVAHAIPDSYVVNVAHFSIVVGNSRLEDDLLERSGPGFIYLYGTTAVTAIVASRHGMPWHDRGLFGVLEAVLAVLGRNPERAPPNKLILETLCSKASKFDKAVFALEWGPNQDSVKLVTRYHPAPIQ